MVRPQLILDIHDELIVDNFAGGGGASTGIEMALGRHVDHAINHDWAALGMHRINHPQTIHHCEDVFDIDPLKVTEGRPVGFGWFSPDCKHFSKAKGGKPLSKRIRGLAFVMIRWARIGTRVMMMENVEEIADWGPLDASGRPDKRHTGRTWRALLDALRGGVASDHPDLPEMLTVLCGEEETAEKTALRRELLRGYGYEIETKEIRGYSYGAPTIRKRLYMIARNDGRPIVWPRPTHAEPSVARKQRMKPWRTVAECIDWSIPCRSIFLSREEARAYRCKRPLADATLRRIAKGIKRYVIDASEPFIVPLTHQGGDRTESVNEPARTITGAHRGEKAVVDAMIAPIIGEHANATGARSMPVDEPLRTQCAEIKGGHFSLVSAHLCREFGESIGQPVTSPAPTVMPGGQGKTTLVAAHLTKFNTGSIGQELHRPAPTVPAGSHSPDTNGGAATPLGLVAAHLTKLRGDNVGHGADEPSHTASAGGQHHAVSLAYLAQHNAGNATNPGHPADEPVSTINSTGSQQAVVLGTAVKYYGNDKDGQGISEPAHTVTTKERIGLCQMPAVTEGLDAQQRAGALRVAAFLREHGVELDGEFATVTINGCNYVIVDIGMRMLVPRELFRCQGFPESYVIDRAWVIDPKTGTLTEVPLTKEQQIRMCGNSVCPPVAEALVRANVPELSIWKSKERMVA